MWNQNQKQYNEIFSGQMTGRYRLPAHHDENLNLVASSDVSGRDILGGASRKRKAVDYRGHATSSANSEMVLETKWSNEPNRQHTFGVVSYTNEQGSSMRRVSNLTACPETGDKLFQPGRYQSQGLTNYALNSQTNQTNDPNVVAEPRDNIYSATQQHAFHQKGPSQTNQTNVPNYTLNSQTNQTNVPDVVAETRDNIYSATQEHAFHQKGSSNLIKAPAAKIPTLPNPQSISFTFLNQIEAHKHSYPDQTATSMDKSFSGHGSMEGMNFGHINNSVKGNSSMNLSFKTSEVLSSSEASQHNYGVLNHDISSNKRNLKEDICKTRSSFEMRCNDQALDVTQTMGTSVVGTSSIETARLEGNVTKQSFQNYISELRVCSLNNGVTSQVYPRDQNDGNCGTQNMEGKEGSCILNENHSLREDASPKSSENPTHALNGTGNGDDSQHVASKLNGESKPHSEKASSVTEKLWDGSLQLSTSATVSAVAFFKSGEKAPEINWSKSIVVKGKVRLEAFERFIQELPRSRSRGLMVTSLCWRAGSSKAGLTGMKEVAKGYKEREKVGYAQISRGIDLYVCPRSDAIITILAKYGFFKGMAALEMDRDSLIGCVVWRRGQPSSDSVAKKSQNENSTSNSVIPQTPFIQPEERFSPIVSNNYYAPHNIPGTLSIKTVDNQIEVGKTAPTVTPEKINVVSQSSTSITAALNSAILSVSCSLNSYMSSQVETPIVQNSGPEKPHSGFVLPRPIQPVSSQTVTSGKREAPKDDNNDDDDLPEFDFSSACGVSQHVDGKGLLARTEVPATPRTEVPATPRTEVPATPRTEVPAERANNISGSMPSALPTVQPTEIPSQQKPQEGSQEKTFRGVSGATQSSNPAAKIGGGERLRPAPPSSDEKLMSHGSEQYGQACVGNPTTNVTLPTRKSMWDDDDDMPEWCPPNLVHQRKHDDMPEWCPPNLVHQSKHDDIPEWCPPNLEPQSKHDDMPEWRPPNLVHQSKHDDMPEWCPPNLVHQRKPTMMSTTRPSVLCIPPSPLRNSKPDNRLPGPPTMMSTTRPSVPCIPPSPLWNSKPDNRLPGPPPTMATIRPPSPYTSSSVPSWKSENIPPGPLPPPPPPPPPTVTSGPSSSYMPPPTPIQNSQNIPIPIPPPPPPTSKPSFSYISSPAPNQKSEITLPGPPPFPSLPPPPPLPLSARPQFHTQGLSHAYQSSITTGSRPSQSRPVGIQPPTSPSPSLGFTYNPPSRPQTNTFDVRPPVWRDRRP